MAVQSGNWVQVLSSYDGLLLVSPYDNPNKSDFSLFNLSPRECKKLPALPFVHYPAPRACWYAYVVGYNSSTDDYNVVILSSNRAGSTMANIYSLNANAWKRIVYARCDPLGTSWGVFFNGCLHCLCWRNGSNAILAFNLLDEIFREVPLSASLAGSKTLGYCVEVVRGCLGLVKRWAYPTDVWMMEDYGVVESWTKFSIDLPTGTPRLTLLCWLPEDNFLFDNSRRTVGNQLVMYNLKKETLMDMVVAGIPSAFIFCGTYVESLMSPNLGGGIGWKW